MKYYLALLLPIVFLVACNNDNSSSSSVETPGLETSQPNQDNTVPGLMPAVPNLPVQEMPSTASSSESAPAASQQRVALNPPHGQPGHRCDIPEGAPLSTPIQPMPGQQPQTITAQPAKQPQTITAQPAKPAGQAQPISIQPSPSPASPQGPTIQTMKPSSGATSPGINPPHGEPGHRCDVEVGAPLPAE